MPTSPMRSLLARLFAVLMIAGAITLAVRMTSRASENAAQAEAESPRADQVEVAPQPVASKDVPSPMPADESAAKPDDVPAELRNIRRRWAKEVFGRGVSDIAGGKGEEGQQRLFAAWTITDASDPLRAAYERVLEAQLLMDGHLGMIIPHRLPDQIAFSPDGARVMTSDRYESTVRFWDARTGVSLGKPIIHQNSQGDLYWGLGHIRFSPDGARLITTAGGSRIHELRLWDIATATPLCEPISQKVPFVDVEFCPDGTRFYTEAVNYSGAVGEVRVWDGLTGLSLSDPMRHAGNTTTTLSPDGRQGVTLWETDFYYRQKNPGARNVRFQRWDVRTGALLGEPVALHAGNPLEITISNQLRLISPDLTRLLVETGEQTLQLWDTTTGTTVGAPIRDVDPIKSWAFSPNSSRLLIGSYNKTAQLWDSKTAKPVGEPRPHLGTVTHVEFCPDGTRFVTVSSTDGTKKNCQVRIWDTRDAVALGRAMPHMGDVREVAFSPDGKRLATGGRGPHGDERHVEGESRLWDAWTGAPLCEPMAHPTEVYDLKFSPDGTRFLTIAGNRVIQFWDGRTGAPLAGLMTLEGGDHDVEFHPDGIRTLIGTGSTERKRPGSVRLWDMQDWGLLSELMGAEEKFAGAAFSPDGSRVLTATYKTVQSWDSRSLAPLGPPIVHQGPWFTTFSPDATHFLVNAGGSYQLSDGQTSVPLENQYIDPSDEIGPVFSPDSSRILTKERSETRLWDGKTGAALGRPMPHHEEDWNFKFSPDSSRFFTVLDDETVRLWNARTGAPIGNPMRHKLPSLFDAPEGPLFSPDGSHFLTRLDDDTARLWVSQTGAPLSKLMYPHASLRCAAFSPNGQQVVTGWYRELNEKHEGRGTCWDVRTGEVLWEFVQVGFEPTNLVFSPDGTRILGGGNIACLWDSRTGAPLGEPMEDEGEYITDVTFSPDGNRVLTKSEDDTVRLWDGWTGTRMSERLLHPRGVSHFTFSPDSTRLLIASLVESTEEKEEGEVVEVVQLWDGLTGGPLSQPIICDNYVKHLKFSPDSTRFLVKLDDGVRIFDVPTRDLPQDSRVLWEYELGVRIDSEGQPHPLREEELLARGNILFAQKEWRAQIAQQVERRHAWTRRLHIAQAEKVEDWYGMASLLLRLPPVERDLPQQQDRLMRALDELHSRKIPIPAPPETASQPSAP